MNIGWRSPPPSGFGRPSGTSQGHHSVITAIALFVATGGDFEQTVGRAVARGDHTDTLSAMGGALCGVECIREDWRNRLEPQLNVRVRIDEWARQLWRGGREEEG